MYAIMITVEVRWMKFVRSKNNSRILIGIISDANKCGGDAPGVSIFTRIGPHLNWLLQQTKDACYCPK